jgi:hypothetical protein
MVISVVALRMGPRDLELDSTKKAKEYYFTEIYPFERLLCNIFQNSSGFPGFAQS